MTIEERRKYDRIYYSKNTIKLRSRARKWRKDNLEKSRKSAREYRQRNKEVSKKWINNNREKYRAYIQNWHKKNRERISTWMREHRHSNLNFKIAWNLRARLAFAIKKIKNCKLQDTTLGLLHCSLDDFKLYLEAKFKPGMSWNNYGFKGWHIDHIKPCSAFDLTKKEEQEKCFHYSNLQPLWAKDNFSKGNKFK